MVPVMGDHVVLRQQGGHRADRDRLLPDVKVQESADLSLAVRLFRPLLEAADQAHLPEPVERFLGGRIDPGRILDGNPQWRCRRHAIPPFPPFIRFPFRGLISRSFYFRPPGPEERAERFPAAGRIDARATPASREAV